MKLTPKNWASFQHYKARRPPWIRLHRKILDDYDFSCLPVASRALAPCLWLIASEFDNGIITLSMDALAFRLRLASTELAEALKPLIDNGFFTCEQDASKMLAERKQNRTTETESDKKEKKDGADAPSELPEARYYRRVREVLGEGAGGFGKKLLTKKGNLPSAMAALEMAAGSSDPKAYIGRICAGIGPADWKEAIL